MKTLPLHTEYKVSSKLKLDSFTQEQLGLPETIYLVPMRKNNTITTPVYNDEEARVDKGERNEKALISSGSPYQGTIHLNAKLGEWYQYRDGCFMPYMGKIAL